MSLHAFFFQCVSSFVLKSCRELTVPQKYWSSIRKITLDPFHQPNKIPNQVWIWQQLLQPLLPFCVFCAILLKSSTCLSLHCSIRSTCTFSQLISSFSLCTDLPCAIPSDIQDCIPSDLQDCIIPPTLHNSPPSRKISPLFLFLAWLPYWSGGLQSIDVGIFRVLVIVKRFQLNGFHLAQVIWVIYHINSLC